MTYKEMTITDVLKDPLIRQMMRADNVSLSEMKKLLLNAALKQRNKELPPRNLISSQGQERPVQTGSP
jgi:hypothetical protein